MNLAMLLGLPAHLHVVKLKIEATALWIEDCSGLDSGVCPRCGTASRQRHSAYSRTLYDAPYVGRVVSVTLHVR